MTDHQSLTGGVLDFSSARRAITECGKCQHFEGLSLNEPIIICFNHELATTNHRDVLSGGAATFQIALAANIYSRL